MAEQSGLEIVGYVLSPVVWLKDTCVEYWDKYIALIDVAEENTRLRQELRQAETDLTLAVEDRAELDRLRTLLHLDALRETPAFAARVIAMRFGPHAVLKTFTVNKGYVDGAIVGTPVVTEQGVVGRVLRAAPHASTILMLTDPGFRVAVISQDSRTPGILTGVAGHARRLDVSYVPQNARIAEGELLITAGVDDAFPKGIPVGRVTQVTPAGETLFLQVHATPIANLERLEEVLLLRPAGSAPPLLEPLPPEPDPEEVSLPDAQTNATAPANAAGRSSSGRSEPAAGSASSSGTAGTSRPQGGQGVPRVARSSGNAAPRPEDAGARRPAAGRPTGARQAAPGGPRP